MHKGSQQGNSGCRGPVESRGSFIHGMLPVLVLLVTICAGGSVHADAWEDYQHGVEAELEGDVLYAQQLFDQAIASEELHGERLAAVLTARAAMRRVRSDMEGALGDLERALKASPGNSWALLARAETFKLMGRLEEALSDVEQVLENDPGNLTAQVGRSLLLARLGRDQEALDAAEASARSAAEAAYRRRMPTPPATAEQDVVEELPDAMEYYDKLVRQHPQDPLAWVEHGTALAERGYLERALADYEKALEIDPNHIGALYNRGVVLYKQGRVQEARRDWHRVRELDPAVETPDL